MTAAGPACPVYVVGEGTTDIGDLAHHSTYRDGRDGFVQPILRKLCAGRVTVEFDGSKVNLLGRFKERGRLPGHADRAAKALAIASELGCRALVFVKDLDKSGGRAADKTERRRLLKEVSAEVEAGFLKARQSDPAAAGVACIKAIPVRMIEAWVLGDPEAVRAAVGSSGVVPSAPEALWGDERDPNSQHPKRVLERLLGRAPDAALFANIAQAASVDQLARSCPESFAPFADEVRAAIDACVPTEDGTKARREGTSARGKKRKLKR
ncbi:MAG: hypothetical protein IT384_32555 [Deltaproteobacteria bacterium]|nr:hypothetical protein [Deltaproteobacteria bacterium]